MLVNSKGFVYIEIKLFYFTKTNGLNIDSDVNYGDILYYDSTLGDLIVKNKIQRDGLKLINPDSPDLVVLNGIGAWIIESTFIVQ